MAEYSLRRAASSDAAAIRWLITRVGINPSGIDWRRFTVAVTPEEELIACGQIKPHGRGVMELASIAVKPEYRKHGIASAIIEDLLKSVGRPIYLTCLSHLESFYERFGFVTITQDEMPVYFRRLSKVAGIVNAVARIGESLLVMKLE